MVAFLAPLPERTIIEFQGREWREGIEDDPEIQPGWKDLGLVERAILRSALANHPMPWQPGAIVGDFDVSRVGQAIGRLDVGGFIERIGAGRRLTARGLAAARWLDSEDRTPPS